MPRRTSRPPQRWPISVEFEGATYSGTYYAESRSVTVESAYGSMQAQVGSSTGEGIARLVLLELLAAAKAKGRLKT